MNDTKRTYTKRSTRWYEKSGDRRTLLYNQAALASPIGQKMLALMKQTEWVAGDSDSFCAFCNNYKQYDHNDTCPRQLLLAEIAEIESAE